MKRKSRWEWLIKTSSTEKELREVAEAIVSCAEMTLTNTALLLAKSKEFRTR